MKWLRIPAPMMRNNTGRREGPEGAHDLVFKLFSYSRELEKVSEAGKKTKNGRR